MKEHRVEGADMTVGDVLRASLASIRENMNDAARKLRLMSAEKFLGDEGLVDEVAGQISEMYDEMDFVLGVRRRWLGARAGEIERFKAYEIVGVGVAVARDLDEIVSVLMKSGFYTKHEVDGLIKNGKVKKMEKGGTYTDKEGTIVTVEELTVRAGGKPGFVA